MFANFATAIPTGAAITFMLLFAMQSLIALQPGFAADTTMPHKLNFLPDIPPEEVRTEDFHKIDRLEIAQPPPIDRRENHKTEAGEITIPTQLEAPKGPRGHLGDPLTNNGPLMAIVRVQPAYPAIASSRGLEGFVVVQFDVLGNGTVTNISVLESSSSIFERSAIRAASRFRFKARVVDGVPQTSSGVQYQFTFKMDK